MPKSWRKFLIGLALFLGAGAGVGYLYGRPDWGLLAAALLALLWHVRQLLAFDRALRTRDFDAFRFGDGIWQQIFSRFSFAHERGERHKRRYRQLLREIRKSTNAMPDGAVVIDADHQIVMCNRAAKRLAGLKPKKDRGQRIDNILRDPAITELVQSEDMGKTVDIESPLRPGDWLNCRVVPYGADQKLLMLRDVTERLRLNRMRRDFVANASHELRSPLTVITGYLDSLADEDIPAGWSAPVAQMMVQARRMNRIVSELLELSRLESAGRANTETVVDVTGLIAGARKAFESRSGFAEMVMDADSDIWLRGNSTQIESVITNLISNALRHTPAEGRVTVTWQEHKNGAELIVADTGEGIAEEHIPRLTERFFRVDRGRARDEGGVGLGLAIVKHVLSRHDASLHIRSVLGAGSEFRCRFPAGRVTRRSEAALIGRVQSA